MSDEVKDRIFSTIQRFLKNPPVIIWGSGATVSLGLPTMGALNNVLNNKIDCFNSTDDNFEIELGKLKYEPKMSEIKKLIWNTVNDADIKVFTNFLNEELKSTKNIKVMVEKFREAHPQVVNIITTNYDRVLEYVLSFYNIPFTDGFSGKELSLFDTNFFQDMNMVNLVKVHGSLNWFQIGSSLRYMKNNVKNMEPIIISPGKNKFQEAYKIPYRDLIQKSDDLINKAASFLVVGFGFNDEHLTPKIKEKVKNGTPIVLITKEVTKNCIDELKVAQKSIFLQENNGGTNVLLKDSSDNKAENLSISGDYWKLEKFMEIL